MALINFPNLLARDSRKRRILIGLLIYVVCTGIFFASSSRDRIFQHTPYNHYAHLADSWLHGRLDMRGDPPGYAGGNDFAQYKGKWFVSFPPFPAVWLLPWVKIAGSAENVRDGQAFLWLAGVGPAVLWLVFEYLRRQKISDRKESTNVILALLFAFGTVYWFTAVQGTVWFAAHVVAVALGALYLLFAIDARRPIVAGIMLGLAYNTRPTMLLLGLLFALEAVRVSLTDGWPERRAGRLQLLYDVLRSLQYRKLLTKWALFALPLLAILAITLWHNWARFGKPMEFGHGLLTVAWRGRIEEWGLFSYHYLGRNLGIVLAGLPFYNHSAPRFQINVHGLALWITTPFYLWLLWPKKWSWHYTVFALSAAAVASMNLLYQNSGWMQFGFRFSNDFALPLFLMLAVGGQHFGTRFRFAAVLAIAVNLFGALTFDRAAFSKYYFIDGSQKIVYQPD